MTLQPKYKYKLASQIISLEYRNIQEFCTVNKISYSKMSRILNGWEIPGPTFRDRLIKALDFETVEELEELI